MGGRPALWATPVEAGPRGPAPVPRPRSLPSHQEGRASALHVVVPDLGHAPSVRDGDASP